MAILKDLIRDLKGIVVPQYLKDDESAFEPVKGSNGALNVNINGSLAKLSTEEFPAGQEGWDLLEIDTGRVFIYHNDAWVEVV